MLVEQVLSWFEVSSDLQHGLIYLPCHQAVAHAPPASARVVMQADTVQPG